MPGNRKSLSEKITELINPNPVWEDPENDITETSAKVVENIPEDFIVDDIPITTSLKLSQCELLDENDIKYSGKKVSRRSLEDLVKVPDMKDIAKNVGKFELSDDDSITSHHSQLSSERSVLGESEDESEHTDDESDSDIDDLVKLNLESNDKNIQAKDTSRGLFDQILQINFSEQLEKGNAVRAQIRIWDTLLEARIQLQKCLVGSNKLPQHDCFNAFRQSGGSDFKKQISQCKKEGLCLLENLLELQKKMLLSFPETQQMYSGNTGGAEDDDDEEIPSSDEEDTVSRTVNTDEDEIPLKKRKLSDISNSITQQHNEFRNYRNSTLEKCYTRSKLISGVLRSSNFSAFDMSVVKQIDHILNNKSALIKRTQKKRSDYQVLGQPVQVKQDEISIKEHNEKAKEDYDKEIYDDDDFYHKLLRELIERKAGDVTDPVQLGRQWTELQKLRKKLKKRVDTKASKGRKIRYVVHPKLVNYMAPIPNNWSDTAMDDLFRSLFGKSE